jgi:hypothetical protein
MEAGLSDRVLKVLRAALHEKLQGIGKGPALHHAQSSSSSRLTAGAAGFLILSQSADRRGL